MTTIHRHATGRWVLLSPALVALALLAGCGYTLKGRVVRSAYPGVLLVDPDDPRLDEPGLGGVSVTVTRDPSKPNREQVGAATSNADGSISVPIGAFGAGITDEEWLIAASRRGSGPVQSQLRLPSNAGGTRLLVLMSKGDPNAAASEESTNPRSIQDEIQEDLQRFGGGR